MSQVQRRLLRRMSGSRKIVGEIVHHYRYIKFPDNLHLKNVKILSAKARDSVWWWWNPYIIEISYAKEWDEQYTTYQQIGKVSVPITHYQHHTTKEYSFKYSNIEDIAAKVREMRDCGVEVENEIKPTNRHH